MIGPIAQIRALAGADRLSHAYLITGGGAPERAELARALAAALVCTGPDKPCRACPHCKKVYAGIHPDVVTLSPAEGRGDIRVEQVRALRADAYVLPNEAGRKVYLIEPASALNPSAQNALLKVLEEGPAYAAFLLLADTAGQLLPTVRSRCEELTLQNTGESAQAPSEQAVTLAGLMAGGRESGLLAFCVELEKLERESLNSLLEQTVQVLEEQVKGDLSQGAALLPKIALLQKLRQAGEFNVGAGHLAGWLCAENCS